MGPKLYNSQHHRRIERGHFIIVSVIVLMIAGGAFIWILNIVGIVPGRWSSILGVIFTSLGVLLALLQWLSQITTDIPVPSSILPSVSHQQNYHIKVEGFHLGVNRHRGALIIKVRKSLRGATINLCHGFDDMKQQPDAASNVTERKIDDHYVFAALFPFLEPGNYTVYINSQQQYISNVTIWPNRIAEVDWR